MSRTLSNLLREFQISTLSLRQAASGSLLIGLCFGLSACGRVTTSRVQGEPSDETLEDELPSGGSGGDDASTGTGGQNAGGARGEGNWGGAWENDPDALACDCPEAGYQIAAVAEIQGGEHNQVLSEVFDQAPPAGTVERGCVNQEYPAIEVGGSCRNTQISGCTAQGECLVISPYSVKWTRADGSVLTGVEVSSFYAETITYSDLYHPEKGSFAFEGDGVLIHGDYFACEVDHDMCLR